MSVYVDWQKSQRGFGPPQQHTIHYPGAIAVLASLDTQL